MRESGHNYTNFFSDVLMLFIKLLVTQSADILISIAVASQLQFRFKNNLYNL